MVLDNVCHRLGVSCRTRPTTPYFVLDLRELVCDSVGNVCTCGGSGIGTENDAVLERDGHDRGSHGHLALLQVGNVDVDRVHVVLLLRYRCVDVAVMLLLLLLSANASPMAFALVRRQL